MPTDVVKTSGVSCQSVTKEFNRGAARVLALQGLNLQISPGELTLIVGPSGCGKTTLISLIAGTLDATSGEISVLGQDLVHMSKREKTTFRARNVGFVFQQFNLLPALTAAENVAVPLVINGWTKAKALERAAVVLKSVGLADRMHFLPAELSGGQQQRVAIARGIVHDPQLLVCDEPTSAIDAKSGQVVMELIRGLALESNRVTMVVTHDQRVFGFADRIVSMDDGRVSGEQRQTPADANHGTEQR